MSRIDELDQQLKKKLKEDFEELRRERQEFRTTQPLTDFINNQVGPTKHYQTKTNFFNSILQDLMNYGIAILNPPTEAQIKTLRALADLREEQIKNG